MSPVPPATSSEDLARPRVETVDQLRPSTNDGCRRSSDRSSGRSAAATLSKTRADEPRPSPRPRPGGSRNPLRRLCRSPPMRRNIATRPGERHHTGRVPATASVSVRPCPNCPKSKPSCAAWRCASPAGASTRLTLNRADLRVAAAARAWRRGSKGGGSRASARRAKYHSHCISKAAACCWRISACPAAWCWAATATARRPTARSCRLSLRRRHRAALQRRAPLRPVDYVAEADGARRAIRGSRGLGPEPLGQLLQRAGARARRSRARRRRSRRRCSTSAWSPGSATYMCGKVSIGPGCRRGGWPAP